MSEARALTNFTGNAVATVLMGTWVKEIERARVDRVLDRLEPFDETTMLVHGEQTPEEPHGESAVLADRDGRQKVAV